MELKTYFCIGCRRVHRDKDYSEKDGDVEITNWERFLESVERLRGALK